MNIKEKLELIDAVTRGSNVRKTINPSLLLGEDSNQYASGDVLDANATKALIDEQGSDVSALNTWKESVDVLLGSDEETVNGAINTFYEIVAFLDGIEDTTLNNILQSFIRSNNVEQIQVLTQSEYDQLETKSATTEYHIIES